MGACSAATPPDFTRRGTVTELPDAAPGPNSGVRSVMTAAEAADAPSRGSLPNTLGANLALPLPSGLLSEGVFAEVNSLELDPCAVSGTGSEGPPPFVWCGWAGGWFPFALSSFKMS